MRNRQELGRGRGACTPSVSAGLLLLTNEHTAGVNDDRVAVDVRLDRRWCRDRGVGFEELAKRGHGDQLDVAVRRAGLRELRRRDIAAMDDVRDLSLIQERGKDLWRVARRREERREACPGGANDGRPEGDRILERQSVKVSREQVRVTHQPPPEWQRSHSRDHGTARDGLHDMQPGRRPST